jgi:hypothetical protein
MESGSEVNSIPDADGGVIKVAIKAALIMEIYPFDR